MHEIFFHAICYRKTTLSFFSDIEIEIDPNINTYNKAWISGFPVKQFIFLITFRINCLVFYRSASQMQTPGVHLNLKE